jgi:hypothetical protein
VDGAQRVWQATLIGRQEIWPVHQKTADLGGMLRTGLEDTFYLPDGSRASGNGALIAELARCAANAGRAIALAAYLAYKSAAQGFDQLPRRRQAVTNLRRSMRVCDLHQRGHAGRAAC